jgi:hypothetical protein
MVINESMPIPLASREVRAMDFLSVSEVACELGAKPKTISDLLYQRELRNDLCPIVGGRRLIPRSYLATIRQVLIDRGQISEREQSSSKVEK